MSTGYVTTQGDFHFLTLMTSANTTLRLYTNDVTAGLTPDDINSLNQTDFDEATFPGYAAAPLLGGSWSITTATGVLSTASFAVQTFTRTTDGAGESIRGHYLTRDSDGALVQFTDYGGPIVIASAGQSIEVLPRIRISDQEATMPIGTIIEWPSDTAPIGYALCQGQAISRTTFAELFAIIGTTFGVGDGSTTFNVPDYRQRMALGKADAGTGSILGDTGGQIDHVHDHSGTDAAAKIWHAAGSGPIFSDIDTSPQWNPSVQTASLTHVAGTGSLTEGAGLVGDTQGSNPPYLVTNFAIRTA